MSISNSPNNILENIKQLGSSWASYSVVISFVLYVFGYLSTIFYFAALGLDITPPVLEKYYVLAGARFLFYLGFGFISILTFLIVVLILIAICYWLYQCLARIIGSQTSTIMTVWQRFCCWWTLNDRLSLFAIVFTVLAMGIVSRKCFLFSNLLLMKSEMFPKEPSWLVNIFLSEGSLFDVYFLSLVAITLIAVGLLIMAYQKRQPTARSQAIFALLVLVVMTQLLLLPVNYGYLLASRPLPKVSTLNGEKQLDSSEEAWRVWESESATTFFVLKKNGKEIHRSLVTLQQKDIKKTEIIGYDRLLPIIFKKL